LPEPPVESSLPGDDPSCAPWAKFCHCGGPADVTVVHDTDLVPYLVRLSDPGDTIAAVLAASHELLDFQSHDVRVLDCATGLELNGSNPAAGRCLWVTRSTPVAEMDFADVFTVSPTLPWVAESTDVPEVPPITVEAPISDAACSAGPVAHPLEPLASLSAERLLLVSEPSVTDLSLMNALRAQTMDSQARKQTLANQGTVWADDEMMYHMQQMHTVAKKPTWAVIDPLLCAEAVKRPSSSLISQWIRSLDFKPTAILGVVCVNHHWSPFIWTWTSHCVIASSWDIPGSPPIELSVLHQAIAMAVGSRTFTVHVVHRSFAVEQLCGICALRFIDHMLRGKMLPTSTQEAMQLDAIGRSLFVAHLDEVSTVPRPWIFGAGLDPRASDRLHGLLTEHGVDSSQVKNRASLLLQAIGLATAQKALTSGQPWRALKAAANQCRPPFQLVLSSELEASVGKKAAQGGLKGKKKNLNPSGKPHAKPEAPPGLDPAKLLLEEGAFATPSGEPLGQVGLQDIGPFMSGVVVCTLDQASAYLRAGQLVSQGSLALLLLNVDAAQLQTTLAWSFLRVILRCQANGEPILVPVYLVQLGQQLVVSKPSAPASEALHEPAACLKVSIYRDSVEDWDQVVRAPVKYFLGLVPPLQACRNDQSMQSCSCPKWHQPADSVVADPVLDVWRRQWVSTSFKPTAAEHADIFIVNFRCLESQLEAILAYSGRGGVFFEPRSLDSKDPNLDYQVLWLPKTDKAELLRLQQCTAGVLGVARVGSRLGLRTKLADAPELAKVLKPGSVFLAAGTRSTYELGPLPFGCDRLTVGKLCAQWRWQARPLHPCRSVDGVLGNMWRVQASTPPPCAVVLYQGNEVVITKVSESPAAPSPMSGQVIGNTATVQLCSKEPSPPLDPWLKNDPWAPAAPAALTSPVVPDSKATIREVENRIEKSLLEKISAHQLEVDSSTTEARFAALEQQVQSLTAHQQQMEASIDASAQRADAQIAALQTQVSTQIDQQGQHIQGMFQAQLLQIEALLNKRARTE